MTKALTLFLPFLWLSLSCQLHSQEGAPRELFSEAYALFSRRDLSQAEELFLKTLNHRSLLEDYSLYFLGMISFDRNELGNARNYLAQLKQKFSRSVWSSRAKLQLAKISLTEKKYQQAVEELRALREQRTAEGEISDEALYLIGQIHEAEGKLKEAYSIYQGLRYTSPLSPWAARARKDVKRLRKQHPQLFALTKPAALSEEGELLLQEREYREAERVYRKLLDRVPQGSLRPSFLMGLANVYRDSRKRGKAISILAEIEREYPDSPEAPNALFHLARIYWNRDENLKALDLFKQLKKRYPSSGFADFADHASARIYESLNRPGDALRIYQDFSKRFPDSQLREKAAWRLAWIHYLQADYNRAHTAFKHLAAGKEGERYKTAALYWQARSAERMGRPEEAKRLFIQIVNKQDQSYYIGPAARRLEEIGVVVEEQITSNSTLSPEPIAPLSPDRSFHLSRARELTQISLNDLAVAELDEIKNLSSGELPLKLVLMREYARNKAYDRSIALATQIHHPSDELNRHRYPLAYWDITQKMAEKRGLDPYLIVGLMRQESLFDPKALSPASAFGLMQLLPSTAARVATRIGLPPPKAKNLFEPRLNLTLGTYYLKELLQRYSNNPVKALAAYNAGENAVARWEREISVEDEEEFIERIPYGETRLYVKLVLRNHRIYRKIYDSQR